MVAHHVTKPKSTKKAASIRAKAVAQRVAYKRISKVSPVRRPWSATRSRLFLLKDVHTLPVVAEGRGGGIGPRKNLWISHTVATSPCWHPRSSGTPASKSTPSILSFFYQRSAITRFRSSSRSTTTLLRLCLSPERTSG